MSNRNIVIVGAGPAGVGAALAARQQDPAADILLITDETCEPYEKPPLSKAVLTERPPRRTPRSRARAASAPQGHAQDRHAL